MNKHIIIIVANLILSTSVNASKMSGKDSYFNSRIGKKLKHVKSVGFGSFRSLSQDQLSKRNEVFIDWRKLYWGKLSDLIYSEDQTEINNIHEIADNEGQMDTFFATEESQSFAKELREELKSFSKRYELKIVWRKKSLDLQDATTEFLEYWDRGLSQEKNKAIPFAELCKLSVSDKNVEEIRDNQVPVQDINSTSENPQKTDFKQESYANWEFLMMGCIR